MTVHSARSDLERTCAEFELPFPGLLAEQLGTMLEVIAQGAAATNLVGDPSPAGVAEHVLEALVVAACWRSVHQDPAVIADIGAGAGIAAFTYALIWPQVVVYAVEPRRLRAEFIALASLRLAVANRVIVVQKSLASAVQTAALPTTVQLADARAVWPAGEWLPRALPLIGTDGLVALHVKGPIGDAEQALALGVEVAAARQVPGLRGNAVLLVMKRP